jgi:hypothetical protein
MSSSITLRPENVAPLVRFIRGEKVLLDADLAVLYAVPTKALNQAVKRNRDRFPEDFMFQLSKDEWADLRCQFGIASKTDAGDDRSQTVTGSQKHRDPRSLPYSFTEQGVAMLSTVLRSRRAVAVNIAIMRTFVQLRRLMDSNRDLARKIETMEKKYDEKFAVVFDAIKRLVADDQARKARPKGRIGFTR